MRCRSRRYPGAAAGTSSTQLRKRGRRLPQVPPCTSQPTPRPIVQDLRKAPKYSFSVRTGGEVSGSSSATIFGDLKEKQPDVMKPAQPGCQGHDAKSTLSNVNDILREGGI